MAKKQMNSAKREPTGRKAGQAAMEFLMTYGWAILIVIVVIGLLYIMGVFSPTLANFCTLSPGFSCYGYKLMEGGWLVLDLGQAVGSDVRVTGVGCSAQVENPTMTELQPTFWVKIPSGSHRKIPVYVQCWNEDGASQPKLNEYYRGKLYLNYTEVRTGIPHSISGELGYKVEPFVAGGWFNDTNTTVACENRADACGDGECPSYCGGMDGACFCCGDGVCKPDRGETTDTCPIDCVVFIPECGDGTCNGDETHETCPVDCPAVVPECGDGTCNGDETHATCPVDCPAVEPFCGDGTCNGDETCGTCPADCGACTGGLRAFVTDEDGGALGGAYVTIVDGGGSCTTVTGYCEILGLPVGSYTLSASLAGYVDGTGSGTVVADQTITVPITLSLVPPQTGWFFGRVTESGGTALEGVTVEVSNTTWSTTATTDAEGNYSVSGLLVGTYNLVATMEGYLNSTQAGQGIFDGEGTPVDFTMAVVPWPACAPNWVVSECPCILNVTGDYTLQGDLSSAGTCITIEDSADEMTLDCNLNTITGDGTLFGIYLKAENSEIRNCIVSNFATGIYLYGATSNVLAHNTATENTGYGIRVGGGLSIYSANWTTMTGNTITENPGTGVYLGTSYYSTLEGNTITDNGAYGIRFGSGGPAGTGRGNTIIGNIITGNNNYGIYDPNSLGNGNNTITGNTICGNMHADYDVYCGGAEPGATDNTCDQIRIRDACATVNCTSGACAPGWIFGNIIDGTGAGILGADVTASLAGTPVGTTVTGTGGSYTLNGLGSGTYNISASKGGYASNWSNTIARSGVGVERNLTLYIVDWIGGRITNITGDGVYPATVSAAGGGSTTTNATGHYSLAGLAAGTYTLTASATGYYNNNTSAAVGAFDADILLRKGGIVRVVVANASTGIALSGVTCTFSNATGSLGPVTTDANGVCTSTTLWPDSVYTLTLTKSGYYDNVTTNIVVSDGAQTDLAKTLRFITVTCGTCQYCPVGYGTCQACAPGYCATTTCNAASTCGTACTHCKGDGTCCTGTLPFCNTSTSLCTGWIRYDGTCSSSTGETHVNSPEDCCNTGTGVSLSSGKCETECGALALCDNLNAGSTVCNGAGTILTCCKASNTCSGTKTATACANYCLAGSTTTTCNPTEPTCTKSCSGAPGSAVCDCAFTTTCAATAQNCVSCGTQQVCIGTCTHLALPNKPEVWRINTYPSYPFDGTLCTRTCSGAGSCSCPINCGVLTFYFDCPATPAGCTGGMCGCQCTYDPNAAECPSGSCAGVYCTEALTGQCPD